MGQMGCHPQSPRTHYLRIRAGYLSLVWVLRRPAGSLLVVTSSPAKLDTIPVGSQLLDSHAVRHTVCQTALANTCTWCLVCMVCLGAGLLLAPTATPSLVMRVCCSSSCVSFDRYWFLLLHHLEVSIITVVVILIVVCRDPVYVVRWRSCSGGGNSSLNSWDWHSNHGLKTLR